MERSHVESSNLESVGYDPDTNTLEVEFRHGGIYQYYGVPQEVFDGLMAADSKGRYFHQHVKEASFRYEKIG